MVTTFVARYVPGRGVAQLFWGKPVSVSAGSLETDGALAFTFNPGDCFGAIWFWRNDVGRSHRVAVIARALANPTGGIELPGILPAVEVRVMVEQAGSLGRPGPVERLLDVALPRPISCASAGIVPLPGATYLRLRGRLTVRPHTLRKMREIFGCNGQSGPCPIVPRRSHLTRSFKEAV